MIVTRRDSIEVVHIVRAGMQLTCGAMALSGVALQCLHGLEENRARRANGKKLVGEGCVLCTMRCPARGVVCDLADCSVSGQACDYHRSLALLWRAHDHILMHVACSR